MIEASMRVLTRDSVFRRKFSVYVAFLLRLVPQSDGIPAYIVAPEPHRAQAHTTLQKQLAANMSAEYHRELFNTSVETVRETEGGVGFGCNERYCTTLYWL